MNILLVHGNGGANARFEPMLQLHRAAGSEHFVFHLPSLPGFEGRPLPAAADPWSPFIEALGTVVATDPDGDWVFYGHGIGGSFLLDWAARGWSLPGGGTVRPRGVIMHSIIGASLAERWFPKVMRLRLIRRLIHFLIPLPALRGLWEKRLFLDPDAVPGELRDRFFSDYRQCAAFPVLFDLITPEWYRGRLPLIDGADFHFLWGGRERVVAADYLRFWRRDFPDARFEVVPEWDHFPMLEQAESFYSKITEILPQYE